MLNEKQKRFVEEYLVDLSATKAAIRAGYSENRAGEIGYQLLQKTTVQVAIQKAIQDRSERTKITQDMVVAELSKLAFSNIGNYVSWNQSGVTLLDSENIRPEFLACVSEIKETVTQHGGTVTFKLHDKSRSLETLLKHLGGLKDILDLTVSEMTMDERRAKLEQLLKQSGLVAAGSTIAARGEGQSTH